MRGKVLIEKDTRAWLSDCMISGSSSAGCNVKGTADFSRCVVANNAATGVMLVLVLLPVLPVLPVLLILIVVLILDAAGIEIMAGARVTIKDSSEIKSNRPTCSRNHAR